METAAEARAQAGLGVVVVGVVVAAAVAAVARDACSKTCGLSCASATSSPTRASVEAMKSTGGAAHREIRGGESSRASPRRGVETQELTADWSREELHGDGD